MIMKKIRKKKTQEKEKKLNVMKSPHKVQTSKKLAKLLLLFNVKLLCFMTQWIVEYVY
jgi:hypothetical protein